ncbi:YfiR family protein [Oxalobacteraceae bacterium OTU3REALA1]|nr:YfiR family protein [Oxalobacteraceae bacterium OTU3REALA1]
MIAVMSAVLPQLPGPALAQNTANVDELADLVLGIVQYTRWPGAPEPITLCLGDNDAGAAALAASFAAMTPAPPLKVAMRRMEPALAAELFGCQAVLFPDMPTAAQQGLLLKLNKRPILTLGRGENFCSYSGQICLIEGAKGLRFRANLDAIAFSGLRLNPRMLQLGVRDGAAR